MIRSTVLGLAVLFGGLPAAIATSPGTALERARA
jgi:hypothetical protein